MNYSQGEMYATTFITEIDDTNYSVNYDVTPTCKLS